MAKRDYNDFQELKVLASWLNMRSWKLEIHFDGVLISNKHHKLNTMFYLEEAANEKEIPSFDIYLDELIFDNEDQNCLKQWRKETEWSEIISMLYAEYNEMVLAREKVYKYFDEE